jgi:hypothetical protein
VTEAAVSAAGKEVHAPAPEGEGRAPSMRRGRLEVSNSFGIRMPSPGAAPERRGRLSVKGRCGICPPGRGDRAQDCCAGRPPACELVGLISRPICRPTLPERARPQALKVPPTAWRSRKGHQDEPSRSRRTGPIAGRIMGRGSSRRSTACQEGACLAHPRDRPPCSR